jgi:hypothetical protein
VVHSSRVLGVQNTHLSAVTKSKQIEEIPLFAMQENPMPKCASPVIIILAGNPNTFAGAVVASIYLNKSAARL